MKIPSRLGMLVIALAGILQYHKLGREEDPPFTIKTMVNFKVGNVNFM
jgi:multidrug efflux pump subunit AcrB